MNKNIQEIKLDKQIELAKIDLYSLLAQKNPNSLSIIELNLMKFLAKEKEIQKYIKKITKSKKEKIIK
jgi:hypothetical protein